MSKPHILIDADACPVTHVAVDIARSYGVPVTLLCDEHHILSSDYAQVRVVSSGAEAVDIALVNLCRSGDIVITQDYGVAAMALGKGANAIHHSGRQYTNQNIDLMLMERHIAAKVRRSGGKHHMRGPSRFTDADRKRFAESFEQLLQQVSKLEG